MSPPAFDCRRPASPAVVVLASPYARDREYLREFINSNQVRVVEAQTYREALAAMSCTGANLIVCDESLRWRDILGYMAESCYPSRLVVLAASPTPVMVAEVLNLGGYDVLAKPFCEPEVRWVLGTQALDPRAPKHEPSRETTTKPRVFAARS